VTFALPAVASTAMLDEALPEPDTWHLLLASALLLAAIGRKRFAADR